MGFIANDYSCHISYEEKTKIDIAKLDNRKWMCGFASMIACSHEWEYLTDIDQVRSMKKEVSIVMKSQDKVQTWSYAYLWSHCLDLPL